MAKVKYVSKINPEYGLSIILCACAESLDVWSRQQGDNSGRNEVLSAGQDACWDATGEFANTNNSFQFWNGGYGGQSQVGTGIVCADIYGRDIDEEATEDADGETQYGEWGFISNKSDVPADVVAEFAGIVEKIDDAMSAKLKEINDEYEAEQARLEAEQDIGNED